MNRRVGIAMALALIATACGKKDEPATTGSGSGTGSDTGSAAVTPTPTWPAAPAPSLPRALAAARWPSTVDELKATWPALADPNGGLKADGLVMRVQPFPPPIAAVLWITRPGLDLKALEAAWGPNTRDPMGRATWFAPDAKLRASYPSKSGNDEGVELAHYLPVLDRIEAAPDGLVTGGGPLLGKPVDALTAYKPWNAMQDDAQAQLQLPPGEWDGAFLSVTVGLDKGRIVRVSVIVRVGKEPVDEASIRARLTKRWGEPKTEGEATVYRGPGVRVEARSYAQGRLTITYEAT